MASGGAQLPLHGGALTWSEPPAAPAPEHVARTHPITLFSRTPTGPTWPNAGASLPAAPNHSHTDGSCPPGLITATLERGPGRTQSPQRRRELTGRTHLAYTGASLPAAPDHPHTGGSSPARPPRPDAIASLPATPNHPHAEGRSTCGPTRPNAKASPPATPNHPHPTATCTAPPAKEHPHPMLGGNCAGLTSSPSTSDMKATSQRWEGLREDSWRA